MGLSSFFPLNFDTYIWRTILKTPFSWGHVLILSPSSNGCPCTGNDIQRAGIVSLWLKSISSIWYPCHEKFEDCTDFVLQNPQLFLSLITECFTFMAFAGLSSQKLTSFSIWMCSAGGNVLYDCQRLCKALRRCALRYFRSKLLIKVCLILLKCFLGYQLTFSLLFGFSHCTPSARGADAAAHKAETAAGGAE